MNELLNEIEACETMPQLDELRAKCIEVGMDNGMDNFKKIQQAFIKKKNQLQRIPLFERNW